MSMFAKASIRIDVRSEALSEEKPILLSEVSEISTHFYGFSFRKFVYTGSNFIINLGENRVLGLRQSQIKNSFEALIYETAIDFSGNPQIMVLDNPNLNLEDTEALFDRDYSELRILDVDLIQAHKEKASFLISMAFLDGECRKVRVLQMSVNFKNASAAAELKVDTVRFETNCFPKSIYSTEGPVLYQSGGAILIEESQNKLSKIKPQFLLTLGDFQLAAIEDKTILNKSKLLLSTVIRVLPNNDFKVVARGTRNSQGIVRVRRGKSSKVLFSEHGPRGGDEINEFKEGSFYGWPLNTLGTNYDLAPQHMAKEKGTSLGSNRPFFAFLPSIGIGQIIQIPKRAQVYSWWSDKFNTKESSGDLIVSGMASKSLYRMRWHNSGVTYVEPINVGVRVRSMFIDKRGIIWLGLDEGFLGALTKKSSWSDTLGTFESK